MKKLIFVFAALAVLAFAAPAANACALCDGQECYWGIPPDYWAAECWFDFCPPCGCYTTGHCLSAAPVASNDLAMEYRIASVEIRQGDTLVVAHKTQEVPAVVAENKVVRK